jgi:hypothetical protein
MKISPLNLPRDRDRNTGSACNPYSRSPNSSRIHTEIVIAREDLVGPERANCDVGRKEMTREQLEQVRESVQAQLRWAMLHGGDEELQELLCFENDRLSAMIGELPRSTPQTPPRTSKLCADQSPSSCPISCAIL